eukprot:60447_1
MDTQYEFNYVEPGCSMNIGEIEEQLLELDEQIQKQLTKISDENTLKIIRTFMEETKMIQHNFRPRSMKGHTVQRNMDHYYQLCDLISKHVDHDLAERYLDVMEHWEYIYNRTTKSGDVEKNKKRKKQKMKKIYGDRISEEEKNTLKSKIDEFIPLFYGFLDDYGPVAARRDKGQIAPGLKIHNITHVPDMIGASNDMRLGRANDERTEHVVQAVDEAFRPYHHFYGKKRLLCAMRRLNMMSLTTVFCNR